MKSIILFLSSIVFIFSCERPVDPPPSTGNDYSRGIWVINEGQFLAGNASVTYMNSDGGNVTANLFETVNGVPLGDIAQSVTMHNNRAWIVVNNSGKITIVNPVSFGYQGSITGFPSPRFMCVVSPEKAYVTNLFGNEISIVNLESKTISGAISANGWTENIMMAGGKVFVNVSDTNLVYVLDPVSDAITDTITVTKGPNSMAVDSDGYLWVLCNGGWMEQIPALYKIDPATNMIVSNWLFNSADEDPSDLTYSSTENVFYYLNTGGTKNGVYRWSPLASSMDGPAWCAAGTRLFYCLAVNGSAGRVYIGDAGDFVNPGTVLITDMASGTRLDSIAVGVAPGEIVVK